MNSASDDSNNLNRREFLSRSAVLGFGASVALAGSGGPLFAQPVVSKSGSKAIMSSAVHDQTKLKKAVKYGMINIEGSVRDRFALLKELGFDGVELDSPSNLDQDEVIAARDETGLPIHGVVDSVHWSKTLSDADPNVRAEGRNALETALLECKRYGGSTVLLVPAVVNREMAYDDAYKRSQEEIHKALPIAEQLGVKIAIENVWNNFLLSPLEAARYIDEFESDYIGWYFDVGNIVNYGYPEQWIRILGDRILKVDVKEFSRKKRNDEGLWKGFAVELLEGDCDWPSVVKAFDEIGYRGWMTAEIPGGGRDRLGEIADRMNRIIAFSDSSG